VGKFPQGGDDRKGSVKIKGEDCEEYGGNEHQAKGKKKLGKNNGAKRGGLKKRRKKKGKLRSGGTRGKVDELKNKKGEGS